MSNSNGHLTRGTLALVGSGEYLPPMIPVDERLIERLGEPARVACLPTAAGQEGPQSISYWSDLGIGHFSGLGAEVRAVEILNHEMASDSRMVENIRWANFVYLSGGRPDYLYSSLAGTPAFQAIEGVLAKGGVVAGCSAGAMIWGERATPFPWHKGFGYLSGAVIIPHFDEMSGWVMDIVKKVLAGNQTVLGIEGNTALVCTHDGYTVNGSGGVVVWNGRRKERCTDGQTVSW